MINCHCERCRRMTGHFMAATSSRIEDVEIEGEDLRWYTPADEPTVAYGFCGTCGSTLFWRSDKSPAVISIAAGTLDTPTGLQTTRAIFTADASDYHTLDKSLAAYRRGSIEEREYGTD
ncbi:MAG: GFA family protein [Acidimicrobiales bacterium]